MQTGKNIKFAIAATAAVIVAVAGYLAFSIYEQHKFLNSISPHLKDTSLRTENTIRHLTEKTGITFEEIIPRINDDIAKIDKSIFDVQINANTRNKESVESVITYMRSNQELLRAINQYLSALNSYYDNEDQSTKILSDMQVAKQEALTEDGQVRNHSAFLQFQRLLKLSGEVLDNLNKSFAKRDESTNDLYRVANKMRDSYINLSTTVSPDVLINPKNLEALIKDIKEKWLEKEARKDQ